MLGIDSGELLLIALVALVVIGPKDLPRVMRTLGQWMGRARGMARHFRSGLDTMMREAELEEMEKHWKAQNERIMRDHPFASADGDWGRAQELVPPVLPPAPAPSSGEPSPPRSGGRLPPPAPDLSEGLVPAPSPRVRPPAPPADPA